MKKTLLSLIPALGLLAAPAAQAEVPARTDISGLNAAADATARESAYRHRSFAAHHTLESVRERLKVGNYSSFENPTGIYFAAGEKAAITLTGAPRRQVTLIVHNFGRGGEHAEYPLTPGRNELEISTPGLAYLDYRDDNPDTAPAVQVDIEGGKVNGVFTHKDTDATWKALLANPACGVLDILGERCQLVYDIPGLRRGCPDRGTELLALYDRIIGMQQRLLGWDQYDCHPGNHIFGRVQWQGFMHADDWGAAFVYDAIPGIADPESLRRDNWGVAHEFGHVNQTRPGMAWAGTSEITNNIFSAWANFQLNPADLRLEHEVCPTTTGDWIRGGRFDSYVNNAFVARQLWQYHGGPDSGVGTVPGETTGDAFVGVCPLWQLQLYNAVARGDKDFFPRIFRKVRLQDDSQLTHGEMRVNLFLYACESAQLDLTEFFVRTGMLAPMDRMVEDYEPHTVTITPEMCQVALEKAATYPAPESSVIFYINGNNVDIFRKRLPVRPCKHFKADPSQGRVEIPAGEWKNAVAFEAVDAEGKLLRVALLGLGHEDNVTTTLICPEGTAAIKAVQWDGERFDITIPAREGEEDSENGEEG